MTDWNWALHGLLDAHTHNKPHPHSQGHREPLCEHWEFTSYFLGFSLPILYEWASPSTFFMKWREDHYLETHPH